MAAKLFVPALLAEFIRMTVIDLLRITRDQSEPGCIVKMHALQVCLYRIMHHQISKLADNLPFFMI